MSLQYESTPEEQYAAYCRHSQEHTKTVQMVTPKLNLKPIKINLNILSVGSGDGQFDLLFLEEFVRTQLDDGVTITYTCIEPNQEFNAKFKAAAATRPSLMKIVSLSFVAETAEKFVTGLTEDGKLSFQLVLFSHSIYHIEGKDAVLTQVVNNLLTDDGLCILLHATENEMLVKFMSALYGDTGENEADDCAADTERIDRLAKRLGFKHDSVLFEANTNVEACFDQNSLDGNLILDFALMKEHARAIVAPDVLQKNLELLTSFCVEKDGCRVLTSEIIAVTIYKA